MDHHAPTSPGAGRRPRAGSRSFSMHSSKSADKDVPQSPSARADKERRDSFMRGESKANPNAAVLELQPQVADFYGARNVLEKVTLDSIRSLPAKDAQGNLISEPDLSNPTRSRWERPLDTIRSFERAIDGDYHRRTVSRGPSEMGEVPQHNSRRSSYYGAPGGGPNPNRGNSYYGNRDSHYDNYGGAPPAPRARFSRGMSEGGMGRYGNGYAPPSQYGHNNGSHEGSDSTGPWANSTDPSSQNSSYERLSGVVKHGQSPEHSYGMHDGYAPAPINEEIDDYGFPARPPPGGAKPAPPAHAEQPRQPIKLGKSSGNPLEYQGGSLPTTTKPAAEKRKSWLGRRFSKNN
ncbi:hypothetical protein K461DRAFT_268838 [Myriangium duriaei CBS 260.36]|uniref:Uncharacterized protein n=1 Tax=Myriangium duriaei CBS 260.36 TaxID=1168546 RepID=A0A9P4IZS6_9PEZI|nr:hypothetical protein K461DRAFT_268838 [Myriangium duriaei CBS 260.36]